MDRKHLIMVEHSKINATSKTPSTGLSLEKLRAGDRLEFSRMVDAYSSRLYRLALKMLGNQQDAEDVLQETFLKAFRHLSGFDGRSSVSTWLYRIAANEALMLMRKKRLPTFSLDEPLEGEEGETEPLQIVDWCCIPEHELMNEEARQQLDKAVQKLPPNLRMAFLLRDIEDLSTQEAAEVLGLSENALKTRLSRARLRLREELTAYYGERLEKNKYGTSS